MSLNSVVETKDELNGVYNGIKVVNMPLSPTGFSQTANLTHSFNSSFINLKKMINSFNFDIGTFLGSILTLFAVFFAGFVIFPFVPFMVHDFYPNASKKDIGTIQYTIFIF